MMEMFKQSISRFKGTNSPVVYKPGYNFSENWEQNSKTTVEKNENLYLSANGILFGVSLLVMIYKVPLIWHLSIYQFFHIPTAEWWFSLSLLFTLMDGAIRIHLVSK